MIRRISIAVGLLAAAVALAACSSSGGSSTGGGTSAQNSAGTSVNYGVAVKYVGGTAGAADNSKTPITIGWTNQQGGAISFPEQTTAFNAAVDLINKRLGGIGGHPLKVVSCLVASTEAQGLTCAQEFHNNKSVVMVVAGTDSLAAQPLHTLLASSTPILGSGPSTPADANAKNTYFLSGDALGQAAWADYLLTVLHAKKIAFLASNSPFSTSAFDQIKAIAAKAGATVTPGLYQSGTADLSSAVLASGARTADAVIVQEASPSGCVAISKALSQYNVTAHVVSLTACLDSSVQKALGDYPKWAYANEWLLPTTNISNVSDETRVYLSAMSEYAPGSTVQGSAGGAFQLAMVAAKILNGIGASQVNGSTVSAALAKYTGAEFMGPDSTHFGAIAGLSAVGTIGTAFYTYEGNGRWSWNGKWVP